MFKWKEKEGVKYLELEEFKNFGVGAYFTSRKGGVSLVEYTSLNFSPAVGDDNSNVKKNLLIISRVLNFKLENVISLNQVHGDDIYIYSKSKDDNGFFVQDGDAIVTNKKFPVLLTYYADCVPLFFFDPINQIVALAHAGRRGTFLQIGLKTLQRLKDIYGTCIKNCFVGIGPSICGDCYQVNKKIINNFTREFSFADKIIFRKEEDYFLDPGLCNYYMMKKAGVQEKRLIYCDICTYENPELFYSYRRDGEKTGRMIALITFEK